MKKIIYSTLLLAGLSACNKEQTPGYNCVSGDCEQTTDNPQFATIADCINNCDAPISFNCNNGICTQLNDTTGTYATLVDCQTACSSYTDSRDAQVYNIVTIDSQRWFKENMRYNVSGSMLNPSNPNSDYGRLYSWQQAQSACPSGWHLPSDDEWKQFERSLGMTQSQSDAEQWRGSNEGSKLKATSGWTNNGNGNNSSGFNALPAGYYNNVTYGNLGGQGYFWTATSSSTNTAWYRYLSWELTQVYRHYDFDKTYMLSCRCVQD